MTDKVAVSGAGGFVGSAICRLLEDGGRHVRKLLGPADPAEPEAERVDLSTSHGTDDRVLSGALDRWLAGASAVVHAAGPPSVAASFADPTASVAAHVLGASAVMDASRRAGVERVVLISSAEVYGRQVVQPVPETAGLAPVSPYGAAKVGSEQIFGAAHRCGWSEVTVLRPFSLYGPGQASHSLLSELLAAARRGGPFEVRDPRPRRDYVWIGDLCDAVSAALDTDRAAGPEPAVFNVASGKGHSVAELAGAVAREFGLPEEISVTGAERPAEVTELVGDTTAAAELLGLVEPMGLSEGLALLAGGEPLEDRRVGPTGRTGRMGT